MPKLQWHDGMFRQGPALSSALLVEWKRAESQENCVTVGTPAMMSWQPSPKDDVSISGLAISMSAAHT